MKLYDQYEKVLKKGQKVAVVITGSIVCKGEITSIDEIRKEVWVEVTWPEGNRSVKLCKYYGIREKDRYCMSEIVSL